MFIRSDIELKVGKTIAFGPLEVSREDILEFANEYDPAPFHTDEEAAKQSLLGGLCASGFHTCALTMRMMCDAFIVGSTSQGAAEITEINWVAPVRPGDVLSGKSEVIELRRSNSRPDLMLTKFRNETYNQDNALVLSTINVGFFKIEEPAPNA